jgi:hypothetical protein
MSNALAIASVTAVLKNLLDNAVIDINSAGPVKVTTSAPDRVDTGGSEKAQLNLFLYSIVPNAGWRNAGMPSRDSQGQSVSNPPLAVDLYYLLSAYEKEDLDAEILLGYAAQVLHENPVLPRDAIRSVLGASTAPVSGTILPDRLKALAASNLAEQAEQIRITPHRLDTEEASKLWTAFQAKYRPSLAYHVSVVIIDGTRSVRSALPVLSRGQPIPAEGRDEGVAVQPDLLPPDPAIESLSPQDNNPSVRLKDILTITGRHLAGTDTHAVCRTPLLKDPVEAAMQLGGSSARQAVKVPDSPAGWPVGVYTIELALTDDQGKRRMTNALPFALAPRVSLFSQTRSGEKVTVVVTCSPTLRPGQSAALAVGQNESAIEVKTAASQLTFVYAKLPAGKYPLRLRVDGIESLLIDRTKTPPVFYEDQKVTIT